MAVSMQPVSSSMISAIGYDAEAEELIVEFSNGARWAYSGVPEAEYEGLAGAGSVGAAFNSSIKGSYLGRLV